MAKKRKLSKRDRKIKTRMWIKEKWESLLEDDDFGERLFTSIQDIDPSFSGYVVLVGKEIKYCFFDGEDITASFDVGHLTEEGAWLYSRPFSDTEEPF